MTIAQGICHRPAYVHEHAILWKMGFLAIDYALPLSYCKRCDVRGLLLESQHKLRQAHVSRGVKMSQEKKRIYTHIPNHLFAVLQDEFSHEIIYKLFNNFFYYKKYVRRFSLK